MNEQLTALYMLQDIDVKVAHITTQIAALTGAKDLRKKYSLAKAAKEFGEKVLLALEIELKDSELKLMTIDTKRNSMEKRLYAGNISNPKELAAVEKEITMLKNQQAQLDPRVLELYDLVETNLTIVSEATKVLEEAEKLARAAIKTESAEKTRLEAELAEVNAIREKAFEKVTDRAIIARYDAIRRKLTSTAIAMVVEGRCAGCHVAVTSYIIRNLYTIDEVQYCENCGRILILDMQ